MRRTLALLLLLAAVLAAREAYAHAALEGSMPPDGAALQRPPDQVELRFSEPVVPLLLVLEAMDGADIPTRVETDGERSRFRLVPTAALPRGAYLVRWRVASVDGHPVAGRVAFAIGATPPPASPDVRAGSTSLLLVRLLHLATTIFGAGGVLALWLLPLGPSAARATATLVGTTLAASLPAAVARFAVAGLDAAGASPWALLSTAPWRAALATGILPALLTTGLGALVLLAALARTPTRPASLPTGAGALLAAAGFTLTGHTATAPPVPLFAPMMGVHVALAMVWLGALVPLAASLRLDPPPTAVAVLEAFSERAIRLVPLLLLAGALLAMRQLRDGGLWSTPWGTTLLVKLLLLAGLMLVAAVNRFRLLPRLAAGDRAAGRALGQLLVVDGGLALLLLGATALLTTVPPPRLAAPSAAAGQEVLLTDGTLAARVRLLPGRAGWNRLEVRLEPGVQPPAEEVRLVLRTEGEAGEPVEARARKASRNLFRTDPVLLVPAGAWLLEVGVLLDPFTRVELPGRVELR